MICFWNMTVMTSTWRRKRYILLNNVLNNLVIDSTNIAFDLINEIVNISFESAQNQLPIPVGV